MSRAVHFWSLVALAALLAGILHGSRISLMIGAVATLISIGIGVLIGAVSGYFGGWIDDVISRTIDTLLSFPAIVLAIAVTGDPVPLDAMGVPPAQAPRHVTLAKHLVALALGRQFLPIAVLMRIEFLLDRFQTGAKFTKALQELGLAGRDRRGQVALHRFLLFARKSRRTGSGLP